MSFKKIMATAVVFALVGSSLYGCTDTITSPGSTAANTSSSPSGPNEIRMNYRVDPTALDVSLVDNSASLTILNAVSEGLYRLDKELKPQPALAKELPQISADGLTYTITLRDGITWADGTPVKTSDFVYSFLRTLDPATKAMNVLNLSWIKGAMAIHAAKTSAEVGTAKKSFGAMAPDDKTLIIKLEKPLAFFTAQLASTNFFPQKEAFVKAQGDKNGTDAKRILGAGPFKLTKWEHDEMVVLEKNTAYWDAANVKLAKVTLLIEKDLNNGLNLYEANKVDYTDIKGDQMIPFKGKPELKLKHELVTGYLKFQQTKVPAFKNAKIRQAFSMAIDRKGLVDNVLVNGSVAATGFIPIGNSDGNNQDFRTVAGETEVKFDVAKAQASLAEGLKEEGLTAMPALSFIGDDAETSKNMMKYLSLQWKVNLGVEVTAKPMPYKDRLSREQQKDYSIVSSVWGADYNDPMTWLDLFVTNRTSNTQDWSNQNYDKLVKAAQTETDPEQRAKGLYEAEKILMDEAAIFPLFFRSTPFVVRPTVVGLILPPFGPEFELKWTSISK